MSKRISVITFSCLIVLCCIVMIIVGTYALFSDEVKVTNHLQAGNLDVSLYRTQLTSTTLTSSGILNTSDPDNSRIEFTEATSENIFGLTENSIIVPGCSFTAKLSLENNGKIAANYYLQFVLDSDSNDNLASQIEITVKTAKGEEKHLLSELNGTTFGSESSPIGTLLVGGTSEFTVTVTFKSLDNATNDLAQGKSIDVDMIVHAVQVTSQN